MGTKGKRRKTVKVKSLASQSLDKHKEKLVVDLSYIESF